MAIILTDAEPTPRSSVLSWFERETMRQMRETLTKSLAFQRQMVTLYGPDDRPLPWSSDPKRGMTISVRLPQRY